LSKIEWTDVTWNPVVGCSKVSAGCKNCYAVNTAYRLEGNPKTEDVYSGLTQRAGSGRNWTGEVKLIEKRLKLPMSWRTPRKVFVNSMSDLFHESLTDEQIWRVFAVMSVSTRHTFQVLTKRPERMHAMLQCPPPFLQAHPFDLLFGGTQWHCNWPLPNVWLGVSVENQETANTRVPLLLDTPAQVRFVSCEPLLDKLTLCDLHYQSVVAINGLSGESGWPIPHSQNHSGLDWVIVGGESGKDSRRIDPMWVRLLREECLLYGVPFFFKQWGGLNKRAAGNELDGKTWEQMPC
jgi:protein gp37